MQGGGGCDPPGVSKLSVVELSGKNQRIALDEYSRLVVRFFGPRSIFDPVMRGQRSNFREIGNFSNYIYCISKTIDRSDIRFSPACSPFNSQQYSVSLQFLDGIYVTHSVPEGYSVTLIGKIA